MAKIYKIIYPQGARELFFQGVCSISIEEFTKNDVL